MENNKTKEYYTIDLAHIFKSLLHRAWLIALAGFIAAGIGFSIAKFAIAPTYASSLKLYVKNTSTPIGNNTDFSITSSEIMAAQDLVKTYSVILKNRTTLEMVAEDAQLSYSYHQLFGMIQATSANETEIMNITVTAGDPYEAANIAKSIEEILPDRIKYVTGADVRVVDSAVPELGKVGPSITKYTAVGMILGAFLAIAVLAVFALMDGTVHDEDYVLQNYDCPVLAKVPDLLNSGNRSHGRYSRYYRTKTTSGANASKEENGNGAV